MSPNRQKAAEITTENGASSSLGFGELLRRHRYAAGFSQEHLAERARISATAIGLLERGVRRAPRRETLALLIGALGLSGYERAQLEAAANGARARAGNTASTSAAMPNNLPTQLSSFVGREDVVTEVKQLIGVHRLVTLVGAAGIGKTRIALHVAAELIEGPLAGIWFVDLAPLRDASLAANTIGEALGILQAPNRPTLETIVEYLKKKHILLVLDNCEHVIDGLARTAVAILHGCAHVHILATSREPLAISGERLFRVPSLGVPSPHDLETLTLDNIREYGAIALFVDRASAKNHRFGLTEQLAPVVIEICRRLDGIALAIELAAARLNVLSATMLAQKLEHCFSILTGGNRSALPRHRTMRALIDWSYDLLKDREQRTFRKLSIFAGGFSLELLTALCTADGDLAEVEVIDLVSSLVDKSLVLSEVSADGTVRYRLLESTRQYALEKLRELGEYTDTARAHAVAMLALAEHFESALELISDRLWTTLAKPELDNFQAALEWALGSQGDLRIGQRLAGEGAFFFGRASIETRYWVRAALQTCDASTPKRVRAMLEIAETRVAWMLGQLQDEASLAASERALQLFIQVDDRVGMAKAQFYLGTGLIHARRINKGENVVREALALARTTGAEKVIAEAACALGTARLLAGDLVAARSFFREALTLYEEAECERYGAGMAANLAEVEFQLGNIETAVHLARSAVEVMRSGSGFPTHLWVLCNCAAYLVALGNADEARRIARDVVILARDAPSEVHTLWALQHLAAIATLQAGDIRSAALILGFINARFSDLKYTREYTENQEYDKMLPTLRSALGTALDAHMDEGTQWSMDQAVAVALRL
jgi:predicted ATPase/transcriptional regulator with XRE-family HTH domain